MSVSIRSQSTRHAVFFLEKIVVTSFAKLYKKNNPNIQTNREQKVVQDKLQKVEEKSDIQNSVQHNAHRPSRPGWLQGDGGGTTMRE